MDAEPLDVHGVELTRDALSAYRRDLERTPDIARFGPHDGRWLRVALRLEQATWRCETMTRRQRQRLVSHPVLRPTPLLALTEKMEAAGALTLAYSTLANARRVWDVADPRAAGIAIFRQARICRTSGATAAAEHFYTYLFSFATKHRLPEYRGRALVGRAILRTVQGDPTAGRRWCSKARAVSGGHPTVVAVASHTEMNAALAQGDRSAALVAGARALATGVLERYDEAGVLVNMASVALQAGEAQAALNGVRRAIKRCNHPRVRLSAFAKGAQAAAALRRPALVEKFAAHLVRTATRVNLPFEELDARVELAEAFLRAGDRARAVRTAKLARTGAESHEFPALVARCDRVLNDTIAAPETVDLSAPALRAIAALAAV